MEGDWVIYYEPGRHEGARVYTAVAKVARIVPDPRTDRFYAMIAPGTYLPFERPVALRQGGRLAESGIRRADGTLDRGAIQWAVRPLGDLDFARIVNAGFPETGTALPRTGEAAPALEEAPAGFDGMRLRVEHLVSRPFRDRVFRKLVLAAYDARCAVTGLKLVNGGGRAEVEAAHIRPVAQDGPDILRNGIALSGTVHWMFDRGLLSLTDDLRVLISRQVNDPDAVRSLLLPGGRARAPARPEDRPHPRYLAWHRENLFKH
jgi:putative restriction endonuclease